ncbi:type II toxin-antitoxin system RnlA family toxin [Caballeronia sp. LjRoot29]|uniref:type II toxin-antitoxin system RnlA family toxin n=1 Tax=Caballeronia sp. LjRoot29 TaxID=3342315 RepID=UPI003ECD5DE0
MAELQKLNLDQSRIETAIKEFALSVNAEVHGPEQKGSALSYELHTPDQPPALLYVYKRTDATTTLQCTVGKNQALSAQVAQFVADKCSRVPVAARPLTLAHIDQGTWDLVLEYLTLEDCKLTPEPINHGVRMKVVGSQRDQVFLHRYNTGKFLMQGRPMAVYAMVVSILCEYQEDKREVVQAQLETVEVHTTLDGLYAELRENIPTAFDFMAETGCAILAPGVALGKIAVELPDYSGFAFPALRGLEYYLKELFVTNGYKVPPSAGLGSFYNGTTLKSACATTIGCQRTVEALETAYKLHDKHRNGLFHADGSAPSMSRTLETRQEATDIVYEVLRVIENTYSVIPKRQ